DDYEPTRAARAINDFVGDNLSNWYVRLNRKRFWGGEMTEDKLAAFQTLYTCLKTLSLLIAPFAPFYADSLYRDLTGEDGSVHLADFPVSDSSLIDEALESRMKMAQDVTSMALALRRKVNLKVRQPLSTVMIPVADDSQRAALDAVKDLVMSEINVKDIKVVGNDEGVLVKRVKPDFKKLGPKHGKNMKAVAEAVKNLDNHAIAELERNGSLTLDINGTPAVIDLADVEVISEDIPGWLVANEGALTIALDVTVTPELRREGIARDIVNRVQNIRKSRGYDITDRVSLTFAPGADTDDAIRDFSDYISRQVLATSLEIAPLAAEAEGVETLSMDDVNVNVLIALNK
ncbi:MAG: class I tRNA ligase family protein, partial [Duncaniella sp.]|nr:class I tRNA ligase family protein [Duncaniella sp.]